MFKVTYSFDGEEIITGDMEAFDLADALVKARLMLEEEYGTGAMGQLFGLSIYNVKKEVKAHAGGH